MNQDTLMNKVSQLETLKSSLLIEKDGTVISGNSTIDPKVISSIFTNIGTQSQRMERGIIKNFVLETDNTYLIINEVNLDSKIALLCTEFPLDKKLDTLNSSIEAILV